MSSQQSSLFLSNYFSPQRRYTRSINLERDLEKPEAIEGYILTARGLEALNRIFRALKKPKVPQAWMITGVYGIGKSAFAQFLGTLCGPKNTAAYTQAYAVLERTLASEDEGHQPQQYEQLLDLLPKKSLFRAVATGRAEPLRWTVIRALYHGINLYWSQAELPKNLRIIQTWYFATFDGDCRFTDAEVLGVVKTLLENIKRPILLILDELGKNLEYVAQNQGSEDLYLLQQLAELQLPGKNQLYFLGLLHQSFGGYSDRLSTTEQQEWNKIQGRFESLILTEAPSQMLRVLGGAIHCTQPEAVRSILYDWALPWSTALGEALTDVPLLPEQALNLLGSTYPLHPLTTLVLPRLCARYAQHDRSLFTFLTSPEPLALPAFLNTHSFLDRPLPTLKLHQLYDYFMESMAGLASRVNLQRWVEVQSLIEDAQGQPDPVLQILKTIGLLNLVTTTGPLRATPNLVALALCDQPEPECLQGWVQRVQDLIAQGVVTHRRQGDELRLWEGSDFDIEAALAEQLEQQRQPLADLMTDLYPLKPIVAQRHYAQTGTLRYFGRQYGDSRVDWSQVTCGRRDPECQGAPRQSRSPKHRTDRTQDGLVMYWLDRETVDSPPAYTADGYPLIVVTVPFLELLQTRVRQVQALVTLQRTAPELKQDGVARRELRHRLEDASRLLEETLGQSLASWKLRSGQDVMLQVWSQGQQHRVQSPQDFQRLLSDLCDQVYDRGIILDNELINRRELTSQSAKARKQVLEALLAHGDQPQLGLEGYGPEVTIYGSVLRLSGIHRQGEAERWGLYPPETGLNTIWDAIEAFCLDAKTEARSLLELETQLAQPPYGIKAGVIPIILVAVLLYHRDTIGLYEDQQFIPQFGMEHVERLLKSPQSFAVKSFALHGIRAQLFQTLTQVLALPQRPTSPYLRNAPLLLIAKPLFSFIRKLPPYTSQTQTLNSTARSVLQTLQQAQEPDVLLFSALPIACGLPQLAQVAQSLADEEVSGGAEAPAPETLATDIETFRQTLVTALQDLQGAYDRLLDTCQDRMAKVLGIPVETLAPQLADRTQPLIECCTEPVLGRFLKVAAEGRTTVESQGKDATANPEPDPSDIQFRTRSWLESVVMVVADKPARSWKDADFQRFETQLVDLGRRLVNLEAIQQVEALGTHDRSHWEACRITVTQGNGAEVNRVVWVDPTEQQDLDQVVDQVLNQEMLQRSPHLREALLVRLSEAVLGKAERPESGADSAQASPSETETVTATNAERSEEQSGRSKRRRSSQSRKDRK